MRGSDDCDITDLLGETNGIREEKMRDINLYAYRLRHRIKLKA